MAQRKLRDIMSGPGRRTEKQKMLAGELYQASDPELQADAAAAKAWMVRYNASLATPPAEQRALLVERLAHVGTDAVIRPPFFCDYGYNIRIADGAFVNFNCVILDVVEVAIGAGTQIGPLVQILTADHLRDRSCAAPAWSSGGRFGSARMSGSGAGR
jgi:maltose O-acetyltransferase